MKEVALAALIFLASCTQTESPSPAPTPAPDAPPAPPPPATLSWEGYGPVHFGMKVDEAIAVVGPRADPERKLDPGCDYIQFSALPGMRFMVETGFITRGDAGPNVLTSLGVSVGDKLEAVKTAHPEVQISPHKYDPTGHYLLLAAPGKTAAVVMEEQNGVVVRIRAGLEPAVEYVESCS